MDSKYQWVSTGYLHIFYFINYFNDKKRNTKVYYNIIGTYIGF